LHTLSFSVCIFALYGSNPSLEKSLGAGVQRMQSTGRVASRR